MLEALRQGMGRHQRRAFWEATIAVCALVAAPEGKVSFATRVRIDNILDNLPDLSDFDPHEFVDLFDRFVEEFRASPKKARARALDIVRRGAGDSDEAELLARIALAVADAGESADADSLEPIKALCSEISVDLRSLLKKESGDSDTESSEPPSPPKAQEAVRAETTPPPLIVGVEVKPDTSEEQPEAHQPEEETADVPEPEIAPPTSTPDEAATEPAMSNVSVIDHQSSEADLSQQLSVEGTTAVIALCGRTKTGALEALRIYQDEQIAEADRALSEKIANEKFWLSPVTLFPARDGGSGDAGQIHVMCLSRPDGSVEALRAFESADQANTDLEFFRNLTNDKMWVSAVQFKNEA